MTRQVKQRVRGIRRTGAAAPLPALAAIALCASLWGASDVLADQNTPQFHRGACQGAYPGWLRGVVDGYNGLSASPVADPSSVLQKVPTPKALQSDDERLGYGDGLKAGFKAGVDFGVELGKAARTPDSDSRRMDQATVQLHAYIHRHCGDLIAPLDWDTTFMNAARTSTATSLNEAHIAMSLAAQVNQAAISAEEMARGAQEAEAKGDEPVAMKFRLTAKLSAQVAANLAQMARSHAAKGREEAVQAIIDAEAAADRAKKAAESAGG